MKLPLAVLLTFMLAPMLRVEADPQKILVFDFYFDNTSPEPTSAAETARIKRISDDLRTALQKSGDYDVVTSSETFDSIQQGKCSSEELAAPCARMCKACRQFRVKPRSGPDAAKPAHAAPADRSPLRIVRAATRCCRRCRTAAARPVAVRASRRAALRWRPGRRRRRLVIEHDHVPALLHRELRVAHHPSVDPHPACSNPLCCVSSRGQPQFGQHARESVTRQAGKGGEVLRRHLRYFS